jgi:predicted nucleotide-binding protein (sugar kinase/HSP70/actin superfamily)
VNCSYPFFGTFFHKLGSNLGIDQADYIIDVARDIFETGMNLMTVDLPSLGINEIEGTVEFNFDKAF